jgi:hypothetical protein
MKFDSSTIFQQNKERWVKKWVDTVLATYPSESVVFFKDTSNPFSNPVGATVKTSLSRLYDALTASQFNSNLAQEALQPIVKLRSVQDFSPAKALGFIFELKNIIVAGDGISRDDISAIHARIDTSMLVAFDLYMGNKRTIYSLRANQARDNVRQLLIKKDLICELPEIDPELAK